MIGDSFPARSAILDHQFQQLRQLLKAVLPANAFYRTKLRKAGVGPDLESLQDFSSFPFTTKAELVEDQAAHPPFGSNLTFPITEYRRYHQTSGSTGTPLRVIDTAQSWACMVEHWIEIYRAAGVSSTDRILFAFSFGPFIGFWLAFDAATKIGALCLPTGGLGSAGRLRMLRDAGATVLCCTPTYALRLAEVAAEEKIDLSKAKIRRIVVAGEPGGSIPSTRKQLETLWPGARVFDHHGMTETGPVTYECPARPGFLHVLESDFIAEVIDPATGAAVESGREGELVLTTLGRVGWPLIRYRTGDLVRADVTRQPQDIPQGLTAGDVPCACGRYHLALKGGILGRVDDMLIVRGVNIYPSAVEHVLRACGGVAEYQVKVRRSGVLTDLLLIVESDGTCKEVHELSARVGKAFQNAFALRASVEVVPRGTLPRFEMKAKRWVVE